MIYLNEVFCWYSTSFSNFRVLGVGLFLLCSIVTCIVKYKKIFKKHKIRTHPLRNNFKQDSPRSSSASPASLSYSGSEEVQPNNDKNFTEPANDDGIDEPPDYSTIQSHEPIDDE